MEASLAHVVMALDLREGGGERKSLHAMCNMLGAQFLLALLVYKSTKTDAEALC